MFQVKCRDSSAYGQETSLSFCSLDSGLNWKVRTPSMPRSAAKTYQPSGNEWATVKESINKLRLNKKVR